MSDDKLGPQKGESADQFKARIMETQREMNRAQAQAARPAAAPAIEPVLPDAPPAPAQVPQPEAKSVPEPVKSQGVVTGNPEIDEWLGKKGFKTPEDMAQSLREMERELHKRALEAKKAEPPPPPAYQQPPVGYPPYIPVPVPGYVQQPPAYVPAPPPLVDVNKLAARYGMDPEDFEKVAAIANDLADSKIESRLRFSLSPLVNQVQSLNKETTRNREMVDLMSDPAFKNPQVQYEMHRVLEQNPAIFDTVSPYRTAYNEALIRIGRAAAGNQNPAPPPPVTAPSSRPPTTAGGGGGGAGAPSGELPPTVTTDVFAKMKLEDKKAYLKQVGVMG